MAANDVHAEEAGEPQDASGPTQGAGAGGEDGGAGAEADDDGSDAPRDATAPQQGGGGRGAASRDEEHVPSEAERMIELEAELADMRDRLARARADYSNLQKRIERDAALERERVKARVLEGFLQVYEYGQMAAFEAERNPGPLADGVKMVVREFDRLLQNEGVQPIGTPGEAYDRTAHEACATEAAPGVEPGHVSRVISQGYRLGDRVLRYAKVAVAPPSGGADAPPGDAS